MTDRIEKIGKELDRLGEEIDDTIGKLDDKINDLYSTMRLLLDAIEEEK